MLRSRKELEDNLINVLEESKLKTKRKEVNDIKIQLAKYDIVDTQKWIDDPVNNLSEMDIRELFLFNEQVYLKTGDSRIDNSTFFTESEEKGARLFSGITELRQNELSFPLTFANATIVGNNAYMVTMSIKTISKLMDSGLLYYNFDTQREASFVRRKDRVVIEPTLNKNSVKQITEHLLQGTLVPTVLVFNAETRTTSDPSGEELTYNPKTMELHVNSDSMISITDGFHRITAARNALQQNPDLEFNFAVMFTNYSTRKAQEYMAQISKANPVSKTRIQELEANRFSDTVVQQLKGESELRGRISQTNRIHSLNRELTTYNLISDSIDEEFKMDTKLDALDVADWLTTFYDVLVGSFPDEFINNIEEARNKSLINDSNFVGLGYIVLASRMFYNNIAPKEIRNIIREINFNRHENNLWKQLEIVDNRGNLTETTKARKAIRKYFNELDIEEYKKITK